MPLQDLRIQVEEEMDSARREGRPWMVDFGATDQARADAIIDVASKKMGAAYADAMRQTRAKPADKVFEVDLNEVPTYQERFTMPGVPDFAQFDIAPGETPDMKNLAFTKIRGMRQLAETVTAPLKKVGTNIGEMAKVATEKLPGGIGGVTLAEDQKGRMSAQYPSTLGLSEQMMVPVSPNPETMKLLTSFPTPVAETRPSNLASIVSTVASLPFVGPAELIEQTLATPAGLASLPFIPGAPRVGSPQLKSAITVMSDVGGKVLNAPVGVASRMAREVGELPYLNRFIYPEGLLDDIGQLQRNKAAVIADSIENATQLQAVMPPEDYKLYIEAFHDAQAMKEGLRNEAYQLAQMTPPEIERNIKASLGMPSGFDQLADMIAHAKDTNEIKTIIREGTAKFGNAKTPAKQTEILAQEVQDAIIKEAKHYGVRMLPSDKRRIALDILERKQAWNDRMVEAGMFSQNQNARFEGVWFPDEYKQSYLMTGPKALNKPSMMQAGLERTKKRTLTDLATKREKGLFENVPAVSLKADIQEGVDTVIAEAFDQWASNPAYAGLVPKSQYWKQLPKDAKYGRLAGMYVHPSIEGEVKSLFSRKEGLAKLADKAVNAWKYGMVVAQPPVQIANNVANAVTNYLFLGADAANPKLWARYGKDFVQKGKTYKALNNVGLFGSGELIEEAGSMMRSSLKGETHGLKMMDNPDLVMKALEDTGRMITDNSLMGRFGTPGKMYLGSEHLNKNFIGGVMMEKYGMSPMAAAKLSDKWGLNYMATPVGVREIRSGLLGGIGFPFITYQLKIAPRMVEAALQNPHRLVAIKASLDAWNIAAMRALGEDPAQLEEFQQIRAQAQAGGGITQSMIEMLPMVVLPIRSAQGNPFMIDFARYLPYGQLFNPRGIGSLGTGPIPSTAYAYMSGKTPFGPELFIPGAPSTLEEGGAKYELTPPPWLNEITRTAATTLAPPVATRIARAIATPMAEFEAAGARNPKNISATILDLLGTSGTRTADMNPTSVPAQLVRALALNLREMDMGAMEQSAGMGRASKAKAFTGETLRRAKEREKFRRSRGQE